MFTCKNSLAQLLKIKKNRMKKKTNFYNHHLHNIGFLKVDNPNLTVYVTFFA